MEPPDFPAWLRVPAGAAGDLARNPLFVAWWLAKKRKQPTASKSGRDSYALRDSKVSKRGPYSAVPRMMTLVLADASMDKRVLVATAIVISIAFLAILIGDGRVLLLIPLANTLSLFLSNSSWQPPAPPPPRGDAYLELLNTCGRLDLPMPPSLYRHATRGILWTQQWEAGRLPGGEWILFLLWCLWVAANTGYWALPVGIVNFLQLRALGKYFHGLPSAVIDLRLISHLMWYIQGGPPARTSWNQLPGSPITWGVWSERKGLACYLKPYYWASSASPALVLLLLIWPTVLATLLVANLWKYVQPPFDPLLVVATIPTWFLLAAYSLLSLWFRVCDHHFAEYIDSWLGEILPHCHWFMRGEPLDYPALAMAHSFPTRFHHAVANGDFPWPPKRGHAPVAATRNSYRT